MKSLKNIFLFKIIFLILLNLYCHNWFLLIISFLLCLLESFDDALAFVAMLALVFFVTAFRSDFLPIGVVEKVNKQSLIVEKGLYRVRVYSDADWEIGDLLFFFKAEKVTNDDELKNNILFEYRGNATKIGTIPMRKLALNRLSSFSSKAQGIFKKILFNQNSLEGTYLSGFYFYYLLMMVKRKDRHIANMFLLLYLLFFGFELKFLVYLIDLLLAKKQRAERFLWQVYFLALINYHLFVNSGLLMALVFSFMGLMGYKKGTLLMAIVESGFFGSLNFLHLFLFAYYRKLKALIFILAFMVFLMPFMEGAFVTFVEKIVPLLDGDYLAIRGKIGIIKLLILVLLLYLLKVNNEKLKLLVFVLVLLLPNTVFPTVTFIDVSQGDAILISDYLGRHNILIDTGSPYNWSKLNRYLRGRGIYKLDYLIVTHADNDHAGNIEALKKEYLIGSLINEAQDLRIGELKLIALKLGLYDNPNDNSLVYYLKLNNKSFLFTGDISRKVEESLIDLYPDLRCDVLKSSHHGSKTGSAPRFVQTLDPDYAIYSTSGLYDHPHIETIRTMNKYNVRQYSTKECGTLTFNCLADLLVLNYGANWLLDNN